MSDEFQFWTHGLSVQAEDDKGLTIWRSAWGARITADQTVDTRWFHIPIPSATRLDDDAVDIYHAWLLGWVSEATDIRRVSVHMSSVNLAENGSEMESKRIYNKEGVIVSGKDFGGSQFKLDFDIADQLCTGPIVISALVKFGGQKRQIRFSGAGARFEEQY